MRDATGELLCWHVYVLDPPIARVWFGGSNLGQDRADRGYANTLLHWEMLLHFRDEGYETYDWGGAVFDRDSPLYSITRFKLGFGGEGVRFFDYWCHFPPSGFARARRRLFRGLGKLGNLDPDRKV